MPSFDAAEEEFEYYATILERYQSMNEGLSGESVDIFVAQEIIAILRKLHDPSLQSQRDQAQLWHVTTNVIVLLLSLFYHSEADTFRSFQSLDIQSQDHVRNLFLTG